MATLESRFSYYPPLNEVKELKHKAIREAAYEFAILVAEGTEGREQSLALTKIEEAMFWANAAIARNG